MGSILRGHYPISTERKHVETIWDHPYSPEAPIQTKDVVYSKFVGKYAIEPAEMLWLDAIQQPYPTSEQTRQYFPPHDEKLVGDISNAVGVLSFTA